MEKILQKTQRGSLSPTCVIYSIPVEQEVAGNVVPTLGCFMGVQVFFC